MSIQVRRIALRQETRRVDHTRRTSGLDIELEGALRLAAIFKRLFFVWQRRRDYDVIDYAVGYREPWIEQSIRDFERRLKD